ncbi:MAG: putative ABC transporter permease [Firmicutes bacterium]|nr:putative ABC transporter permease [Bacillota bacterium]
MGFHFNSWLVYFYFYSIFGWLFESGNVSIRQKKWVNRGFMKGPWLPLYGSGAVVILVATLPFAQYPVAVFFAGAVAATVLEYFTGVAMLELFKVRYWDYSYRKIQFQGHICLVSTIVWGLLSLLMVYIIHPWVAHLVGAVNVEVVNVVTFIITLLITYDFTNAFREAMDLRKLIIQAAELKERLEEKLEESREQLEDRLEEKKDQLGDYLEEKLEERRAQLAERKEQLEERKEELEEHREMFEETIAGLRESLEEMHSGLEQHSRKMFLRNPGASFKGMDEETRIIKQRIFEAIDDLKSGEYSSKSAK